MSTAKKTHTPSWASVCARGVVTTPHTAQQQPSRTPNEINNPQHAAAQPFTSAHHDVSRRSEAEWAAQRLEPQWLYAGRRGKRAGDQRNTDDVPVNGIAGTRPSRLSTTISMAEVQHRTMKADQYYRRTQEVARIDYRVIAQLPELQSVLNTWLDTHVYSAPGIDIGRIHALDQRLPSYLTRRSETTNRPELLPCEVSFIQDLGHWLVTDPAAECQVVEVGLNVDLQICKVGLVVQLPAPSNRYLFVCLGMDRGLKTFYITEFFKDRTQYQGKVPYWSLEDWKKRYE